MQVALVTWAGLPELAIDDRLLASALRDDGHSADACIWDDAGVPWSQYDAIVLRSTWDYHTREAEFRAWLASLGDAPLWNPRSIVEPNLHKEYLLALPNAVPSRIVATGTLVDISERSVVKPTVSATAFRTAIVDRPFSAEFEAIVQPFVPEVVEEGEWSLVFFAGVFSHAVLKRAKDGDFRVQHDFGGTSTRLDPPAQLIADAAEVLRTLREPWLYARVDGVNREGRLLVMELELTEPSLFLDGRSARRFANALVARTFSTPMQG